MGRTMTDDDRTAFSDALTALGIASGQPVSTAMRDVYWQFLRDLGRDDFLRAVGIAGRTLKFFPKPSELRDFAEGPGRITPAMQWAHVRRTMDTLDVYGSPDFGAVCNAVIHALGGWKVLCEKSIPELVWYQKDFERLYAEYAAKDLTGLRIEGHVGEFGKPPTWCALPGTPEPPKQIESPGRNGINPIVRGLADDKTLEPQP